MTRYFLPLSAALALVLAAPGMAQQTLNVRDADIRAFIQDAARVTGRTFIIDNRVQGKVSVVTDRPLSRSEYFEIVLSTLRANGLVAVPAPGGAYRIQPADGAAGQPSGVGRAANRNSFVTEVFRLRSIDAASALETLRPLVSKDGSVTANRAGNSVVVADYADNIARIRQVIARVDRDISSTQMVMLKNAGAREIATSLQALVESGGGENAPPSAATVVPIDSSNAIAIRGDANTVARLAAMARQLDQQAASGTEIRVYWLEHADAEKLLPVFAATGRAIDQPAGNRLHPRRRAALRRRARRPRRLLRHPLPPPAAAVFPRAARRSSPAMRARTLSSWRPIATCSGCWAKTIRQIDTRREQVLVEAIIVEISDAAAKKLGVQFLIGSTSTGFAATNYSNASPNLLTLGQAPMARRNWARPKRRWWRPMGRKPRPKCKIAAIWPARSSNRRSTA